MPEPLNVKIYHNPDCGTSRSTLKLIQACGFQPEIIEYLKAPPSQYELMGLLDRMGMPVREVLREKGTPFAEFALNNPAKSDDNLHAVIQQHPILLNRPIVVTDKGVKLCRPSDVVLDLLPEPPDQNVVHDDGRTPFLTDHQIKGSGTEIAVAMEAAGLPTADLADPGRTFYRYTRLDREMVGYGGFELYGTDVLLRSMAIAGRFHRQGNGRNLAALLMRRAYDQEARKAFALTTSPEARAFFEKLGFAEILRSAAPAAIQGTRQASGLCPASASLLTKRITL